MTINKKKYNILDTGTLSVLHECSYIFGCLNIFGKDKMRYIAGYLIDLNVLIDSIKTKRQNYEQTPIFAIIEILTPV